jgi:hypothetical protein
MNVPHIDLIAVFIATVVNMVIGFVWYSRYLFGKSHETSEPENHHKLVYLWHFIVALVTAYVLAFFEAFLGVTTVSDGMFVAFLAWGGFVATTQLSAVIWGKMPFKRFLIHTGCQLLTFLSMGGIIGA